MIMRFIILSLVLLCSGCSITKNISDQPPYNQCIGKKFVLKEDMYIFKDDDTSLYSIAPQNSGLPNVPRFIDPKYIGRHIHNLTVTAIVSKGSIFNVIRVINAITFDDSYTRYLIAFDNIPSIKNGIITTEILNLDNPPYTPHWSDPPIFEARYALPLPSDGIWW
ncbi:hypothetical protein EBS02_12625, partial [bacterium]|nr:hypothetical protein [bacterium]